MKPSNFCNDCGIPFEYDQEFCTECGTEKLTPVEDTALKFDDGKPMVHLVPNEFVYAAARAFMFGIDKYDEWNWTKGMKWSRLRNSLERHLRAWADGEDTDPESGLAHLDHLAACLAMLIAHVSRGYGEDDRFVVE